MKAVGWCSDILIARGNRMQSMLSDVIAVAKRSDGIKIRMERPQSSSNLDGSLYMGASCAQIREGCIQAVDLGLHVLPERARVLAEIHRRFDSILESDDGVPIQQSRLESIMDFAGAWALAARLMRAGLSVLVCEEGSKTDHAVGQENERADVELLIPIGSDAKLR